MDDSPYFQYDGPHVLPGPSPGLFGYEPRPSPPARMASFFIFFNFIFGIVLTIIEAEPRLFQYDIFSSFVHSSTSYYKFMTQIALNLLCVDHKRCLLYNAPMRAFLTHLQTIRTQGSLFLERWFRLFFTKIYIFQPFCAETNRRLYVQIISPRKFSKPFSPSVNGRIVTPSPGMGQGLHVWLHWLFLFNPRT